MALIFFTIFQRITNRAMKLTCGGFVIIFDVTYFDLRCVESDAKSNGTSQRVGCGGGSVFPGPGPGDIGENQLRPGFSATVVRVQSFL